MEVSTAKTTPIHRMDTQKDPKAKLKNTTLQRCCSWYERSCIVTITNFASQLSSKCMQATL
eukprot:scaffold597_cov199-Alexandrium_tamarense.AAC.2